MENASKALIMSAEILIGILILSLMVFIFASFTGDAIETELINEQKRITQFNERFTQYQIKDKDGNEKNTIYDVITIANYAREINIDKSESEKVKVFLGVMDLTNTTKYSDDYLNNQIKINVNEGKNYKVNTIEYSEETGKVTKIVFKEI